MRIPLPPIDLPGPSARDFLRGAGLFLDPRPTLSDVWWTLNNPLERLKGEGRAANPTMMFPMGGRGGRFRPDPRRIRELKQIPTAAKRFDPSMQQQLDEAFEGDYAQDLQALYGFEAVEQQQTLRWLREQEAERFRLDRRAFRQEHSPSPRSHGKERLPQVSANIKKMRQIAKRPAIVPYEPHKHSAKVLNFPDAPGYRFFTRERAKHRFARMPRHMEPELKNRGPRLRERIKPYSVPKQLRYSPDKYRIQ